MKAHYIGCCDDGDLRWVQYIIAENPVTAGKSVPYYDVVPPFSKFPYVYGPDYTYKLNLYYDYTDYIDWLNGLCP